MVSDRTTDERALLVESIVLVLRHRASTVPRSPESVHSSELRAFVELASFASFDLRRFTPSLPDFNVRVLISQDL